MIGLDNFLPMASVIGRAVDLLHKNKEESRPFGINDSWLVHDCPRKAWYKIQGIKKPVNNYSQLKRIGNVNREIKRNIKTDLFGIGLHVKDQGKEAVAFDPETGLMISGWADGILENLEVFNMGCKSHLLSIFSCGGKAEKDKRFISLQEKGFESWYLEYQVKAHVIAHLLKLERIIVIVENRNDSQRYYERVKTDRDLAKSTIEQCFMVMKMPCAPEKRKCPRMDWWGAKSCEYREECF